MKEQLHGDQEKISVREIVVLCTNANISKHILEISEQNSSKERQKNDRLIFGLGNI